MTPGRPLAIARKVAISAFILFHVASVLWWNIPLDGFYQADRRARLPDWLVRGIEDLSAWKVRTGPRSAIVYALEEWTRRTGTWQNWGMFAPNPISFSRYVRVHAVLGTGRDGKPIYDPEPLWTSYRGTLEEEITRYASLRNFFATYTHDHKLIENLTMGSFDPYLEPFARYFAGVYERKTGRRPVAIHLIATQYDLPPPFSGQRVWDVTPREWILWWQPI